MVRNIDVESVDLAKLAAQLGESYGSGLQGVVVGRTMARDAIVQLLGCSELEAENLVETLISRGWLVADRTGNSDDSVRWRIETTRRLS